MELNEYQKGAMSTANWSKEYDILYPSLGLAGEAGEVSNKVKKVLRDCNGAFTDSKKAEIAFEIGDVLWYCAALADNIGYSLEEIADMNLNKLQSRKNRGVIGGSGDHR